MKILVFAPHAAIWIHAFPEALVAEALAQAGHELTYVTCGNALSTRCVPMSAAGTGYESSAKQRLETCRKCEKCARLIQREFAFSGPSLQGELTEADSATVREAICGLDRNRLREFRFHGVPVAQFALYEYLILQKKMTLQFSDEEWRAYLTHFEAAMRATLALERIMARIDPEVVLLYNGLYSVNMCCRELAARRGASVYFLHAGGGLSRRLQTLMLGRDHSLRYFKAVLARWPDFCSRPAPIDHMRAATDHFIELLKGRTGFSYSATKSSERFDIRERFGIDADQTILVATMSSYDEEFAAESVGVRVHARTPIFKNQVEWINGLVNFVRSRPELFLIIRVHPRELPNRREGARSEHSTLLQRSLVNLPGNITVNWPTDGVSLYDLAETGKVFLNSWSSAGKEMSMLGHPVVTYANDVIFYPGSLNYTADSAEGYFRQIDRALADGWNSARIRDTYRWLAIEFGMGLVDIGESYFFNELTVPPLQARLWGRMRRAMDSMWSYRRDCRRRAPHLNASRAINRVISEGLETVLDTMDIQQSDEGGEAREWAALRAEVSRLMPFLYPSGQASRPGSLHERLERFVSGDVS